MTWGLTAVAAATVYSAHEAGSAADEATAATLAGQQAATALGEKQLDFQQEQWEWQQQQWEAQQEQIAPFQEAGLAALGRYQNILDDPSALADDPALQYLQQQGQERVESSAAARGTQLSGRTLESLAATGQGIASQYRGQILGELSGLMGMGTGLGAQQVAGSTSSAANAAMGISGGYGNLADLAMQGGQITAAGILGQSAIQSNLIQGLGQTYGAYLNRPTTPIGTAGAGS